MLLHIENTVLDTTYYPVAVISFVVFLLIFHYVSPVLSSFLCPAYSKLSRDKQIGWNSRVGSSVHAAVISCLCIHSLVTDEQLWNDPIWDDNAQVRTSCAIVVGYFISDFLLMIIYFKEIGEIGMLMHHFASMYAYYYVMSYGVLPFFANYRLMAEFSTVFVNNRWFLSTLGYKLTDSIVFINGWTMAGLFFACRILSMPYYWYKIYSVYNTPEYNRLGNAQYILLSTCFVLDVLNWFWFYKLCRGILRILKFLQLDANRNVTDDKVQ